MLKDSMLCARTYIPDGFVDLVAGIMLPFVLPDFPLIFSARIKLHYSLSLFS